MPVVVFFKNPLQAYFRIVLSGKLCLFCLINGSSAIAGTLLLKISFRMAEQSGLELVVANILLQSKNGPSSSNVKLMSLITSGICRKKDH